MALGGIRVDGFDRDDGHVQDDAQGFDNLAHPAQAVAGVGRAFEPGDDACFRPVVGAENFPPYRGTNRPRGVRPFFIATYQSRSSRNSEAGRTLVTSK